MRFLKIALFLALSLVVGLFGCTKEQKTEAPKQEQVTKNLVPPTAQIKGPAFSMEVTDLKVSMMVNPSTKALLETPNLRGSVKITNISKDVLDIQGITIEYLDEAGKPIPYTKDEKVVKVNPFWKAIAPEATTEGTLDVTLPMAAIKDKPLKKIEFNLVYVPSPLKRETLTLSEKIE